MNVLLFLIVPFAVVILASVFIYVRGHQPQNMHSGISGFEQEMKALSPDATTRKPRRFEADPSRPTRAEPARPMRPTRDGKGH